MPFPGFPVNRVVPLSGQDYLPYVVSKFRSAKWRIWSAIFVIEVRTQFDFDLKVRDFLGELECAAWRGIDVKILLGISETLEIRLANAVTGGFLRSKKVDVRHYRATQKKTSLHSKYLVIDDELIIVGGHNWSPGAFGTHVQESLAVYSTDLNRRLGGEFYSLWKVAAIAKEEIR